MKRWIIIAALCLLVLGVIARGMRPVLRKLTMPERVASLPTSPDDSQASAVSPLIDFTETEWNRILRMSPVPTLPDDPTNRVADDPRAALLGQYLFYDVRLSKSGQVSCATCHDPALGFSNGKPFGEGEGNTARHVLTLYNVGHQRWFYWDGRADTLWAQAIAPIEHEDEMGFDRVQLIHLLHGDAELKAAYESIFGALPDVHDNTRFPAAAKPMSESSNDERHLAWQSMTEVDQHSANVVLVNIAKSLAAYQRKLLTEPAPFDVFVQYARKGQPAKAAESMSASAQRGLQMFVGSANCHLCHSGPLLTDFEFHTIGMPPREFGGSLDSGRFDAIQILQSDPFNAVSRYSDDTSGLTARRVQTLVQTPEVWGAFKTPTLRNVSRTAPYMREGQIESLEAVLEFYSTLEDAVQIGHHHQEQIFEAVHFSAQEKLDMLAFLRALTSPPLPEHLLQQPSSPVLIDPD